MPDDFLITPFIALISIQIRKWGCSMYLAKPQLHPPPSPPHSHHGVLSLMPCSNCTSQCPGEAFVDDTDLWLTGSYPFTPLSTLVTTMQRVAQVWECLLFASGSALAQQKCFYYLVHWKWTPHGFPISKLCHRQPNNPPPNDLRKVNILHHHTQG